MIEKTNRVMTEEEFKSFTNFVCSFDRQGCISERPCYNCKTVYRSSPCFCIGNFTCEVCGHKNGIPINFFEQSSNKVTLNIKEHKRPSWDEYFLKICETVKLRSEDLFVQHGAVLVDRFNRIIGTGYNALIPDGTYQICDYYKDGTGVSKLKCITKSHLVDISDRDARRKWMFHAEKNAIRNCSVDIRSRNPCTMYITARPCFDCMQDMIISGIKRVVCYDVTGTITEDEDEENIKKLIKVSNIEVLKVKLDK